MDSRVRTQKPAQAGVASKEFRNSSSAGTPGALCGRVPLTRRASRGFSLIEIMIVVAIILVIASIAIPKINASRMQAHEMAAIRTITAIHTAQTQYMSQFGKYAASLTELGPPASGNAGPSASDLLPGDLAAGNKSGYKFTVTGTQTGYSVNADPSAFNNTGRRTFFSDQSLVIRQNWGQEPATVQSKEIQ